MIIPIYISESSPPAIRGKMIGVFEIFLQCSQIFGFWVNYGVNIHISPTDDAQWHIPFALQFIPGGLLSICMWFQPESPRWLLNADRVEQARTVLTRLRKLPADHDYLNWEINTILQQIQTERAIGADRSFVAKVKEIFSVPASRKRLLLGVALMWIQNLSGINALNYYSPAIFEAIGFTGTDVGLLATGVFGIVKAGATTIFMIWGIERLGRRNALLIGSVGAMTALLYMGAFAKVTGSFEAGGSPGGQSPGAYVAIVMVYIFAVFYAISWNGIPWIFWYVETLRPCSGASANAPSQCRGLSHGHPISLHAVHDLQPMACSVHHRLLYTLHDGEYHLRHLFPVRILRSFRYLLHFHVHP